MQIQLLFNGNLEMSASPSLQAELSLLSDKQTSVAEAEFVETYLVPMGYRQISPEDCGALTDATLITDGVDVWGDMDYQIHSFIEELANGKTVIWHRG